MNKKPLTWGIMFCTRAVRAADLDYLFELSKLENFLNLPRDKKRLSKKIELSEKSFSQLDQFSPNNSFLFVLEEIKSGKIVGCSNLHAQHGTPERPHYFLQVEKEIKTSKSHDLEFTHKTLKLGLEVNGHTEIGGLVLHPDYRGHRLKLGKQISFSRFLFISLYPHLFTEKVHTELLPPFDVHGNSPLWEGLGKQFFNMEYLEADIISRSDKNFIFELFPAEHIYVKLLSPDAQSAIGEVGESTKPVKKMLEKIGFEYQNEVDPFDGGPHYRCLKSEILPIKKSQDTRLSLQCDEIKGQKFLICPKKEGFIAHMVEGKLENGDLQINIAQYPQLQSLHQKEIKAIPI